MPYKPERPCGHPICPNMAQPKKKYCKQCEEMYEYVKPDILKEQDKKRYSSSKRGYDKRWRAIRKIFLGHNPLCSDKNCNRFATEVDHIKPLESGGTHKLDNLQGFCKRHHSIKTVKFDGGFGNSKKKYKSKPIDTGPRKKNASAWANYRDKGKK